jgi:hypothetical protein
MSIILMSVAAGIAGVVAIALIIVGVKKGWFRFKSTKAKPAVKTKALQTPNLKLLNADSTKVTTNLQTPKLVSNPITTTQPRAVRK